MTVLPSTRQHRISKLEHGLRRSTKGVVIHVMDGTLTGTLAWWARPANVPAIGAHVAIGKSEAVQTANLDAICYHAPGDNMVEPGIQFGNSSFVGIEHEGGGFDSKAKWLGRSKQLSLSANRTAWILYHYKCGRPKWNHNVVRHANFSGTTHKNCPGAGFPVWPYMVLVHAAYARLVATKGRTWSK